MNRKLGRLPADPTKPKLKLGPRLTGVLPTIPATADYMSRVQHWPMYANDRYGDCVFAMIGHYTQAATAYGEGVEEQVTDADVLKGYSDVTGFDPNDPSTDQGTIMQEAMSYWRKTGIGGHKIVAFASVDPKNHDEVKAAIAIFGAALIGFYFPSFAWDQLDDGNPWTYPAPGDKTIEGGHAVHVGKFEESVFELTTWGAVQAMDSGFWDRYVDEVWVVITEEWLNEHGQSPTGLDLHGLGEDFAQLTGLPNPFPDAPAPQPLPADPDEDLEVVARSWLTHKVRLTHHKELRAALLKWLAARDGSV